MAWMRRGGRGDEGGKASSLCRLSQPSGAVRTTSSYVCRMPLRVCTVTCGEDRAWAPWVVSKKTTSSLKWMSAFARAVAAISATMALYVPATKTFSGTALVEKHLHTAIDDYRRRYIPRGRRTSDLASRVNHRQMHPTCEPVQG